MPGFRNSVSSSAPTRASARTAALAAIAVLLIADAAQPARAQPYPTQNITFTVAFPAGGIADVVARLVERVEGPRHASAVVGIGINVLQRRDELPVDTATSVAIEAGRPVDRVALLAEVVDQLASLYDAWVAASGDARASGLLDAYTGLCATVGQEVRVQLPRDAEWGGLKQGTAVVKGAILFPRLAPSEPKA